MGRYQVSNQTRIRTRGFTVIELIVVITVIAILAGVVISVNFNLQAQARDTERTADIGVITRSIERYYQTESVALGGTYPSTASGTNGIGTIVNDIESVKAPTQPGNSVVMATSAAAQTPTAGQYIYQPLTVSGAICNATPCVRFKLYYYLEVTKEIIIVNSMRQQ